MFARPRPGSRSSTETFELERGTFGARIAYTDAAVRKICSYVKSQKLAPPSLIATPCRCGEREVSSSDSLGDRKLCGSSRIRDLLQLWYILVHRSSQWLLTGRDKAFANQDKIIVRDDFGFPVGRESVA